MLPPAEEAAASPAAVSSAEEAGAAPRPLAAGAVLPAEETGTALPPADTADKAAGTASRIIKSDEGMEVVT